VATRPRVRREIPLTMPRVMIAVKGDVHAARAGVRFFLMDTGHYASRAGAREALARSPWTSQDVVITEIMVR
jgi:hypothetical protein